MNFTPKEIAEIAAETVEESVKDFDSFLDKLTFLAEVTLEISHSLQLDKEHSISFDNFRNRGLSKQKALAWKACVKLREKDAKKTLRKP